MHEPLELRKPFSSEDERANYMAQLLELDRLLVELRAAAALSDSNLTDSFARLEMPRVAPRSNGSPEVRLRRWANLFGDELDAIHRARNRIVHNVWISDYDVRTAVWLAEELFSLITGRTPSQRTAS